MIRVLRYLLIASELLVPSTILAQPRAAGETGAAAPHRSAFATLVDLQRRRGMGMARIRQFPLRPAEERIDLLMPNQVNAALMKASGNPNVTFMHCLPAFRDARTSMSRRIAEDFGLDTGIEISNDGFESELNLALTQADNRMPTITAMLVATLGD